MPCTLHFILHVNDIRMYMFINIYIIITTKNYSTEKPLKNAKQRENSHKLQYLYINAMYTEQASDACNIKRH